MFNLNLFKRPIEISTLESWSKFCDDIGKVAFVAIPPIIYSNYSIYAKMGNLLALFVITYGFLLAARTIRQFIDKEKK